VILDRTVMRLMLHGGHGRPAHGGARHPRDAADIAAIAARVGEHVEPELLWARLVQRLILPVIVAFVGS